MEIEIDLKELKPSNLVLILGLLGLIVLGVVGYTVTPQGNRLLTWEDWQVRKAQVTYRREVGVLQTAVERLAQMVNRETPDPLRAQIVAERVLRDLDGVTLEMLTPTRQAVADAALAVQMWAVGGEWTTAREAVERAAQAVAEAGEREP